MHQLTVAASNEFYMLITTVRWLVSILVGMKFQSHMQLTNVPHAIRIRSGY